ncbi:hypothetical protein [Thermosulfidibacter takaii]|uniref:hypothetical protein n=1 Tax=Thermosulfidibacter takaii TaxID=412593 RepID=UPI000837E507|nr:hypothetical protein [Thermosulfidibacter takaii]
MKELIKKTDNLIKLLVELGNTIEELQAENARLRQELEVKATKVKLLEEERLQVKRKLERLAKTVERFEDMILKGNYYGG